MAELYIILVILVAYSTGVLTLEVEDIDDQLLDEIIELEHLKEEGFTEFDVSTFHEIDHVTGSLSRTSSDSLHRRRRSLKYGDTPLHFTFTAFHKEFRLTLRYNNDLLSPNTPVTIHRQGKTERFTGTIPDCLLYGQTDEHGAVSLTYCDGIRGSVADREYLYRLDSIGPTDEQATETILVSKSHLSTIKDRDYVEVHGRSNQSERRHDGRRWKREYPKITVEVGVYLDEIFWAILHNAGDTTPEAKIKKVARKWNFAQAMMSIIDELGYNITIQIKGIHFWENNPSWFKFTVDGISATMNSFCPAIRNQPGTPEYDHLHLHSGVQDKADGLSFRPGACVQRRCAVSSDRSFDKAFITGHELGHSLGMRHDTSVNCSVPPIDGYMAPLNYPRIGWSSCSKDALHAFVTSHGGCLNTVNVPNVPTDVSNISFSGLWPGMELNNDQICKRQRGLGWQRREYHLTQSYCGLHSCVNMNEGPDYGIMATYNLAWYGVYCGEGKVCEKSCITIEESRIPRSKMTFIAGGWTDWGPTSNCSRECGTGLKIKARTCTNPAPLNSAWCEGSAYHGIVCNQTPCADEPSSVSKIRKARASAVCQRLLDNGLISSDEYTSNGDRRTTSGLGQCEVLCKSVSGNIRSTFRFALMPDAIQCDADIMTSIEARGYPRGRRIKGFCVKGQCEAFGCDGQSGSMSADMCGVCGGDNSTCQSVDKIFCGDVAAYQHMSIVTIPAGATSLQFHFNYRNMYNWFIELFDSSDNALISFAKKGHLESGDTPMSAAGADWHYLYSVQYLYTYGTITEDVIVKFNNYNTKDGTDKCLYIGFSLPLDVPIPAFVSGVEDDPAYMRPNITGNNTGDTGTGTGGKGNGTGDTGNGTGGTNNGTGDTGTGTGGTGNGTGDTGTGTGGTGNGTGDSGTGIPIGPCVPGSFHCTTQDTCFSYEELCSNRDTCGNMTEESDIFCQSAAHRLSAGLLVSLSTVVICLMLKQLFLL